MSRLSTPAVVVAAVIWVAACGSGTDAMRMQDSTGFEPGQNARPGPSVTRHPDEPPVPPMPTGVSFVAVGAPDTSAYLGAKQLVESSSTIVVGQASVPRRVAKSTLKGDHYFAIWTQTVTIDLVLRGELGISTVDVVWRGPDTAQPDVVRLLEAGAVELSPLGLSIPDGRPGVFFLHPAVIDAAWIMSEPIDETTAFVLTGSTSGFMALDGSVEVGDALLASPSFPHIPPDFPGLSLSQGARAKLTDAIVVADAVSQVEGLVGMVLSKLVDLVATASYDPMNGR